jgi:hypothetical protein
MPRQNKRGKALFAAVAAASVILELVSAGCKDSTGPESTLSSILVTNVCGAAVITYLDGTQKATIENTAQASIDNVAAGSRLLEAKKADDGLLVLTTTITIQASTTTYVTVGGPASVVVTNQYGEVLSIYEDDKYVGDIGDQITQTILHIPFGTHVFQAKKRSDGTVAAELTIIVNDLSDHTWIITP